MNRTSTNIDMIRHIYNELEENKTIKINIKKLTDSDFNDEISGYLEIKSLIDELFLIPSERVINNIKDYSKKTSGVKFINDLL